MITQTDTYNTVDTGTDTRIRTHTDAVTNTTIDTDTDTHRHSHKHRHTFANGGMTRDGVDDDRVKDDFTVSNKTEDELICSIFDNNEVAIVSCGDRTSVCQFSLGPSFELYLLVDSC